MTSPQIRYARILAALTLTASWLLCLPAWGASDEDASLPRPAAAGIR